VSPEQQRSHPRYEVSASADVAAQLGAIQNLSVGGICIQTEMASEVGAVVDVVINFPDTNTQLALQGQVVWANREPPPDVGIRWIGLDEARRAELARFIDQVKTRQ
jgi:Tfp pilus assembly protein PilZ